jgi:serine/threonine protein kinase
MAFYCIHCRSETDPKYKACPYCGEAITDFLRRYVEMPVDGKYQLLARLGVGGMGEVYKVLHVHLNAIRVIKPMRPAIAGDRGAKDGFLREARLATKINHPNVSSLFDFSTLDDGSWYMVWEYIEGTNLHDLLEERGPLSPRYAAKLAIQALTGLEAIHRAGIVHRDISPENMMITRDADGEERVKIIDLGIAKQWSEDGEDKTKTGVFVGKWKYCSPEHLGIVLYEMLTGAAPFQAETPHGYLMLHASEAPRKDRSKQFATARDFAQALEATLPALSDAPGAPAPARPAAGPTELSNPQYKQPITQIVDVAAGEDALVNVQFSDAANAPLPGFQ